MSNVKLSRASREKLEQVHPLLQKVCLLAFETMPFDITVTGGQRTIAEQKANVAKGVSWTMNSKHLIQSDGHYHAIDMVPYPVDWKDLERFHQMAVVMFAAAEKLGIKIRWGGTWNTHADNWRFNRNFDGPHFELVM